VRFWPAALACSLAVSSCHQKPEKHEQSQSAAASANPWSSLPANLDSELAALHEASAGARPSRFSEVVTRGPADKGSRRDERERNVLALLAGGEPGNDLPLVAVDRGKVFEPALRQVVMPGSAYPARVEVTSIAVEGGLSADRAGPVIGSRMKWYEACYVVGLQRSAKLAGDVTVHFTVGAEGATAGVALGTSSLSSKRVTDCLLRHSQGLRFSPPQGSVASVVAKIHFAPWSFEGNPNVKRH
jgi:hypothetical protein